MHVVSIGGGLSSTMELSERVIQRYGKENCEFIFCLLPNEHPDVFRLISEVERWLGITIQPIGYGLTPMQWFHRIRYLGDSRHDPCSRDMKRRVVLKHLNTHHAKGDTTLHVGITTDEIDRMLAIRRNWAKSGWKAEAILSEDPTITREYLLDKCDRLFGWTPEMYRLGFTHHNCHGACIKAGKAQWARLLYHYPLVYSEWEQGEKEWRGLYGDQTILTEMRHGEDVHVTLTEFRERMQSKWATMLPGFDPFEGLNETPTCVFCTEV